MAKILFSGLVDEIIGKLAGSVFQYSYGGWQVHAKGKPRNPQTKYQQLRRGDFGFLSSTWRNLTTAQRNTFISNAPVGVSGLNFFITTNVNLILIGIPTISSYVPTAIPSTMDIQFISASTGEIVIQATGGVTTVPAGTKLLIQVTYLKAPTQLFTNPSQYSPIISFDEGTDLSIARDILTEWQSRYGQMKSDKRLCLKANVIDKSNGNRSAESVNCTNSTVMITPQYVASLAQGGAAAPVTTEKRNVLGVVTWTRAAAGIYVTASGGLFTGNVAVTCSRNGTFLAAYDITTFFSGNELVINTFIAGVAADGVLSNFFVEVSIF